MKSAASVVSGIAAAQWGLLTTAQAEAVGVSRSSLARMCERGDLERVGQGVYVLVGAENGLTALRAAWLSLAPALTAGERLEDLPGRAVVSHTSSAALHELGDPTHDIAEFIVPELRRTIRAGIRLHRAHLEAADVTVVEGLPVTTIERTVADLLSSRQHGDPEHVARIVGDALIEARLDVDRLIDLLEPLAPRYRQPDGVAFVNWLVELSGYGPTALAANLSSTALGRQVVGIALQNALPAEANSSLKTLIATLVNWLTAHPGIEQDVEVASRAALADRDVAEAMEAVRGLSPEVLRTIDRARREQSSPSVQRSIRDAGQAWSTIDPAAVRAITSLGGRRR